MKLISWRMAGGAGYIMTFVEKRRFLGWRLPDKVFEVRGWSSYFVWWPKKGYIGNSSRFERICDRIKSGEFSELKNAEFENLPKHILD